MSVDAIGVTWYRREDYERLKAMFKDGEKLPDTYEDWLAKAQVTVLTLAADRLRVERAYIDPETFPNITTLSAKGLTDDPLLLRSKRSCLST